MDTKDSHCTARLVGSPQVSCPAGRDSRKSAAADRVVRVESSLELVVRVESSLELWMEASAPGVRLP